MTTVAATAYISVTPQKLAELQEFVARYIPLTVEGNQVVVDEMMVEPILRTGRTCANNPLVPEQFEQLKEGVRASFNAVAKPLTFDASELKKEAPEPLRTLVMAAPEKITDKKIRKEKAHIFNQWFSIRHALVRAGAHIETVPLTFNNGGFREVYTRDRHVIVGDTAYLPDPDFVMAKNFPGMNERSLKTYPGEIRQIKKTLEDLGVKTVVVKDAWFEGGNVVRHYSSNTLFFGIDWRTKEEDAQKLIDAVNATQEDPWKVVPVKLTNSFIYHLDVGLSEELPNGEVLFSSMTTDSETYEKVRAIIGFANILPLSPAEVEKLATNFIDVGDTIVMTGNCTALKDELTRRGYQVILPEDYQLDNFEFGKGGVHCMTNDIRQPVRKSSAPAAG